MSAPPAAGGPLPVPTPAPGGEHCLGDAVVTLPASVCDDVTIEPVPQCGRRVSDERPDRFAHRFADRVSVFLTA